MLFNQRPLLAPEQGIQIIKRLPQWPVGVSINIGRCAVNLARRVQEVMCRDPVLAVVGHTRCAIEFTVQGEFGQTGFFFDLPPRCLLDGFAGVDAALGQHGRVVRLFAGEGDQNRAMFITPRDHAARCGAIERIGAARVQMLQVNAHGWSVARGRRTSSPLQFGQTWFISAVQSAQNVHSYVQMNASPAGGVSAPHCSQVDRISNAIDAIVSGGSIAIR